ncbi:phage tail sheath family protein [Prevotella sp. oral taxon 376]|uniref:phage tail sheath family protein n=1 Tax=Prevotella sp. oral taxon 376 TaxID=712466 RepID=UPI000D1FB69F|nr:phage tail sheath C-terminal domain-containing protein [Prevotella sp. oral taxon 376]PTL34377.1 phage tail sheath family protein [Prevotella sp. oral taxon 376]
MNDYKTPGVYVEEISKFPPSVAGVATAIPVFIGITEKSPFIGSVTATSSQQDVNNAGNKNVSTGSTTEKSSPKTTKENGQSTKRILKPVKVISLLDFESKFGGPKPLEVKETKLIGSEFVLYDSMRLFFDNGGAECYVVSVASFEDTITEATFSEEVFKCLETVPEITIVLFPDAATNFDATLLGSIQKRALSHCAKMQNRIALLDVKSTGNTDADINAFREAVGTNNLNYGAGYYPFVKTNYAKDIDFYQVAHCFVWGKEGEPQKNSDSEKAKYEAKKYAATQKDYDSVVAALLEPAKIIPPSGAMAGIICTNDAKNGVWNAPANISINSVSDVNVHISDTQQGKMNVPADSGISVNAIRYFRGKGILVWGARTLDSNSNEWRYIQVRRLFAYIEQSVKNATAWAVFQPNTANTWVKVRCQIENFLSNLWRDGALAGSTTKEAFYVSVGLRETMTEDDINKGIMKVEIGLAAVRPAEFIVLQFSHKVQES